MSFLYTTDACAKLLLIRESRQHKSPQGFIRRHGGYQNLLCFRKAEILFDATSHFCDRHIERYSRTRDQMIQAARSGKQNILEGSQASGTSSETEIKLVNVARASLEELLEDYRDFLRLKNSPAWDKHSPEALYMRKLACRPDFCFKSLLPLLNSRPPATCANMIICLIHQTNYLLDQLLRRLELNFLQNGGLREAMSRARRR